jgi:YNFM family putative membrane transporter
MASLVRDVQPATPERVVFLLGLGTAVSLLGDSTLYTVLPRPEIAAQAGVSLVTVGVLLGANRAVRMLTNGLAGLLYDRFPRHRLLALALALGALSTLLFAAGYGPAPLLLSRLLWGAAWSGIWVGGNAVVLDVASPHNRGRLSGQYQMWFFVGTGGAALLGGLLTDLAGFRPALLIGGGLTMLAALMWARTLPDLNRSAITHLTLPADVSSARPFPWLMSLVAAVPMFVTRFVFAGIASATAILWLSNLVGEGLAIGRLVLPLATLTGAFVALRALVSVAGARVAGHLADRAGGRWQTTAVVLLAGAVGVWLAADARLWLAVAGALAAAVAAGGVQALAPILVGDHGQAALRGRMLSVVYTLGDLGSALGPPLALGLLDWLTLGTVYRLCGALLGCTVVFALWQARRAAPGTGQWPDGESS